LERLLGPPGTDPSLELPSVPVTALVEASRTLATQTEGQLAQLAHGVLGVPHFRLAGVEDVAQTELGVVLEEAARQGKRVGEERRQQASTILQQVQQRAERMQSYGLFRGGARARVASEVVALLRDYLAARWDCV